MSQVSSDEIIRGYAEEVLTYIPSLKKNIGLLRENPDRKKYLDKLSERISTIKGASALIGMEGLSFITSFILGAVNDIKEGKLEISDRSCATLSFGIDKIDEYCTGLTGEGVNPRDILKKTIQAFRRLYRLPKDKDEKAIAPFLEKIPQHHVLSSKPVKESFPQEDEEQKTEPANESRIPGSEGAPVEIPEIMPELLESFYEEAKEHLEDLDRILNALESEIKDKRDINSACKEMIRRMRRSVHTIKGAAAVIGLSTISAWGHAMEDFLDWLYEKADKIDPEIVNILMDSEDLLASIVADPKNPGTLKAKAITERYAKLMGRPTAKDETEVEEQASTCMIVSKDHSPDSEHDPISLELFAKSSNTLRVDAVKIDELVNLVGEIMISHGAFEQHMNHLMDNIHRLENAKNYIREIAREMEIGFEVKALAGVKSLVPKDSYDNGTRTGFADGEDFEDFDTLELDRYSRLNLIIRTLNDSVIDLSAIDAGIGNLYSEFDGNLNRQRILLSELQDKMMRIRMLPMATLSNKLRRTVRELSKTLGKNIRLIIKGEKIELDRLVLEKITDPLMHLLRNAADHGIETPEIRKKSGKPARGIIKLSAFHDGNQVVIRISDDGRGFDYDLIRKKAVNLSFLSEEDRITKEDLAAIIFKPGFSTCDSISEVSGRGVGMDVVRENIQAIKGSIKVSSETGKGTSFTIRIPLTLTAIRALLFKIKKRIFCIPLTEVKEIIRAKDENLILKPKKVFKTGNDVLPLHFLDEILKIGKKGEDQAGKKFHPVILIVGTDEKREAIAVDALVGQKEIVIKSTGSHLKYVKGIAGVTIMGDGSVVPILNIPELIGMDTREAARVYDKGDIPEPVTESIKPLSIMVVDDSASIRKAVSRLFVQQGWEVKTAKDGIEAFELLAKEKPDLIVLDIEMPRMNGYEFLKIKKKKHEYRHIPVVMLTSRATAKHRDKAIALGARGFVFKPFKNEEFIELILELTR